MFEALNVAQTGLAAQNHRMAVISNNLANINTVGFKRDRANFDTLLYQNLKQPGSQTAQGAESPTGLFLGTGVAISSSEKLFSQGNIINTENALDLAVDGVGFFQVTMPDGTLGYTRNGAFTRNENGELVTSNGYILAPALQIPADVTNITIGRDGTVSATVAGDSQAQQIGQVQIATFPNPGGLQPMGESFYRETIASGAPLVANPGQGGAGQLLQGSLEASNVNVVEELVNMIETQRAYELNSKAISSIDAMMRNLTQST